MFPDDPIPPLEPRAGDYDAMLARVAARRRARRLRGAAALASTTALAVAIVALPTTGDPASLRVTGNGVESTEDPSPTPEPAPSESPGEQPSGEEPGGEEPGGETPMPSPSGEGGEGGEGTPDPEEPTDDPAPSATPSIGKRKPSPTPMPQFQPARYAYVTDAAPADCRTEQWAQSAPDSPNWCAVYVGEETFVRNTDAELPFRLCRSAGALVGPGTLTKANASGGWLKARVVDGDENVPWHWAGTSRPTTPTITVEPGDCVEWTITWDARVETGSYVLNPVFVVKEFAPVPQPEFPIAVTD